jgi:cyclopropane fatty-acyl-phospholipid synthase-like methyltransferase
MVFDGSPLRNSEFMIQNSQMVCPICETPGMEVFFRTHDVPVIDNVFWPTRDQALQCLKGDIELAFCSRCECVNNLALRQQSVDYEADYDNSLHFSPVFRAYAKALAAELVERYQLRNKTIVEIGCGKGEFLAILCELGQNRGIGFDPSYANGKANAAAGRGITYINAVYSASSAPGTCDLICGRHVLEHIADAKTFLADVRHNAEKSGSAVFFEVPNAQYMFREAAIWDIIYPHAFYFVAGSLRRLFQSCGFRVTRLREGFGEQYLMIDASPNGCVAEDGSASDVTGPAGMDIQKFRRDYENRLNALTRLFSLCRFPIVLWGAGSKGVALLNKFKASAPVEYVVDLNPHKHGKFVPGTGQQVVAPEFLKELKPATIIIMNPNYEREIKARVHDLGLDPEFVLASVADGQQSALSGQPRPLLAES